MNLTIDLNTLLLVVMGGILTWGIKGIFSMRDHLAAINGRLGKSEVWQEQHNKQDDERNDKINKNLSNVWKKLDSL